MKHASRLAGSVLAIGALASAALIWTIESDLRAHRRGMSSAQLYWVCDKLPSHAVLVRTYASAVILSQRSTWMHGLRWPLSSLAYATYFRFRLSDDELVDRFLRTPALRERDCTRIGETTA